MSNNNKQGSTVNQITTLNAEIKYLDKSLAKKDKHGRKGLLDKVALMRRLIKYNKVQLAKNPVV